MNWEDFSSCSLLVLNQAKGNTKKLVTSVDREDCGCNTRPDKNIQIMNRRTFLQAATLTGASASLVSSSDLMADHHLGGHSPKLLEWRQWKVESAEKRALIDRQLQHVAIPALNRAGIQPVGVFYPRGLRGAGR